MDKGPYFIERSVFEALMADIPRVDGVKYEDIDTVYGDMSRLVVAWLASTPPEELRSLYNELGWKGSGNARAFHAAAKSWLKKYHPARYAVLIDTEEPT